MKKGTQKRGAGEKREGEKVEGFFTQHKWRCNWENSSSLALGWALSLSLSLSLSYILTYFPSLFVPTFSSFTIYPSIYDSHIPSSSSFPYISERTREKKMSASLFLTLLVSPRARCSILCFHFFSFSSHVLLYPPFSSLLPPTIASSRPFRALRWRAPIRPSTQARYAGRRRLPTLSCSLTWSTSTPPISPFPSFVRFIFYLCSLIFLDVSIDFSLLAFLF